MKFEFDSEIYEEIKDYSTLEVNSKVKTKSESFFFKEVSSEQVELPAIAKEIELQVKIKIIFIRPNIF